MIRLVQTRLMHFSKHYKSLLFWLLLPLFASVIFVSIDAKVEDQLRIPIGIVIEKDSPLLGELRESIEDLPLIETHYLSYEEAMHELENHTIDSVFEFPAEYDEAILGNDRRGIVSHYTSNMSFAAIPVKESIVSFIQEQLNRSKAATTVEDLFNEYNQPPPAKEEVIETSKDIQKSEQLIETTMSYVGNSSETTENNAFISALDIWVLFVLFSTMMMFEWIVRERNHPAFIRLGFTAYHPKRYLLSQLSIYIVLFTMIDLLTFAVLVYGMNEGMTASTLITSLVFRITTALGFFLVALLFKQRFSYITGCIFIFLILVGTSGMILPIDGIVRHIPLFADLHPLQPVMHGDISYIWLILSVSFCILWLFKKENAHVRST